LREAEVYLNQGKTVGQACKTLEVSEQTYYRWRREYGGMDGIENELACPEPLNNVNIYDLNRKERQERGIGSLPGSLAEAMSEFEGNHVMQDSLGKTICDVFRRAKWAEVKEYRTRVTDWEIERYLEVA